MTIEYLMTARRCNLPMANIIERGIKFKIICGKYYAASYLTAHGVSFNIVVRVLAEPLSQRRRSDISN